MRRILTTENGRNVTPYVEEGDIIREWLIAMDMIKNNVLTHPLNLTMISQKTFVQYRYCPLCCINHKEGKKHALSKRHQDIVANILTKFLKKISIAKASLQKPSVKDRTWSEADEMFWCYFCQRNVARHMYKNMTIGECAIEEGGLLEHIVRNDHVEKTVAFLKENKQDLKSTSDFIIHSDVYLKYLEETESACSEFFKLKAHTLNRVAAEIRTQTLLRQSVVVSTLMEQNLQSQGKQQRQWKQQMKSKCKEEIGKADSGEGDGRGKRTIQAFGEGLTTIDRRNEDDSAGNIYSNAPPPWMQADSADDDQTPMVVGPTIADLEKHCQLEKKRRLPAGRVGAKFDHKTEQSESWLPNFGGVWSHGRRTDSVTKFQSRLSKSKDPISKCIQSSSSPSLSPLLPTGYYSHSTVPLTTATVTIDSITTDTAQSINSMMDSRQVNFTGDSIPHSAFSSINPLNSTQIQEVSFGQGSYSDALMHSDWIQFNEGEVSLTSTTSGTLDMDKNSITSSSPMTIKPYVRKRKSMTFKDPHCLSSTAIASSSSPPHPYNTSAQTVYQSDVNYFSSLGEGIAARIVSNISQDFNSDIRNANHLPVTYQRPNNSKNNQVIYKTSPPFRLISTPVLNKSKTNQKSRLTAAPILDQS